MGEETSLAQQLRKLAAPQTSILYYDKLKPSLLFDPRDAASLDRDTIFAYGRTGLDKLISMEKLFHTFKQILFSENSKTLERSVQTKEVNQKLDKHIAKFLRMLSPFFLLRAAHEAMEWLIHRFHIHLFNVDDLIACVLPHYESRIFVRVIQLLDLKSPSGRWHWLKPIQDSGVPLDTLVILRHFNSDGGFRKFVCDLVPDIMKVYKTHEERTFSDVVKFSTLTVYHAMQLCKSISDSTIATLLPFIVGGLKSEVCSYCSGTYMILCAILVRAKLEPSLVEELIIRIAERPVASLQKQSLELILLAYQQQDVKHLPKKALRALCSSQDIVIQLECASRAYHFPKFLQCLLECAVPSAYKQELLQKSLKPGKMLSFLLSVLNSLSLGRPDVEFCLRLVFNWYNKLKRKCKSSQKGSGTLKKVGKKLLKCLETRWAEHFDFAVESYFKNTSSQKSKGARTLLNKSVTNIMHELIPDTTTTLFLGVNHPVVTVRSNAVSIFLKKLSNDEISDLKFVEDTLIARLKDDCPDVLLEVLISGKVLFDFLSKEQLFTSLNSVLSENRENESPVWHSVKKEALKLICNLWELCGEADVLQSNIFAVLLPFFLPLGSESLEYLLCILNSTLGSEHCVISAVRKACRKSVTEATGSNQKLVDVISEVMISLIDAFGSLEDKRKYELVSLLMECQSSTKMNCCYNFIIVFILQHVICTETDPIQKNKLTRSALQFFASHIDANKMNVGQENLRPSVREVVKSSLKVLQKKKFPVTAVFYGLQNIIGCLKVNCFSADLVWWPDIAAESECSSSYVMLLDLFRYLTSYVNSCGPNSAFEILLGIMIQIHFQDLRQILWFLSSLWSNYAECTLSLQGSAIKIAEACCLMPDTSVEWIYEKSCVALPSALVLISSQNQQIRTMALGFLQKISCQDGAYPLKSFVQNICNHSEEIVMDSNQFFQVVGQWLYPAVDRPFSGGHQSSEESDVLEWLQHLVVDETTPKVIKLNTLLMLELINSKEILSAFLPVLKHYLIQYKEKGGDSIDVSIIQSLLNKFDVDTAGLLNRETSEAVVALSLALQLTVQRENLVDIVVHELALKKVTKEFFLAIPSSVVQQKILGMLIDLYLTSNSADMTSKINKTLRKLCVYASQLLKELHGFEFASPERTVKEMRRSKAQLISAPTDADILENGPWKKIVVILEIIQNKKKINQKEILVPELFNILNKTLVWENQPSVEYIRQLVLASIFNCCDQLGISGLDETKFQVELVVQCIRVSENPKTHHQALLLLNLAATMFPDYVLNNMMSIFTFMGSKIVRQDDSYSFQVISQTIETIVPALLQASHQQKEGDSLQVIATVIRVFIDSLLHIPRHRQIPLFTKLITTLGPSDYLWLPLAQICESYVSKENSVSSVKKGLEDIENNPLLEFSFSLFELFSPTTQVNACTDLVRHLTTLPGKKGEKMLNHSSDTENLLLEEPFNVAIHTDLQLQLYKYTVLFMVNVLLSSQNFIGQVSDLDEKYHSKMEQQYKSLFEITVEYIQHLAVTHHIAASDSLWQSNTSLLYDLLNNINSLLPCDQFISFILTLLQNKTPVFRHKTLEILNAKLEHQSSFFTVDKYGQLLKLLKPLLKIIRKSSPSEDSPSAKMSDNVRNRQNALFSLFLLCKIIGNEYPSKFQKVLLTVVEILSSDSSNYPLVVNALLCLAQLCKCLKAHVLPQLNTFMPKIVSLLEESHAIESNDCLALGVVTALQGLVEYLGVFLSSFMDSIVSDVCQLSTRYTEKNDKKAAVHLKLQELLELIAAEIPVRVLVPAVHRSYEQITEKNTNAVSSLMFILRESISNISLTDLQAHSAELEEFLILTLDFRTENPVEPLPVTEEVEGNIIASIVGLVMKLSESAFHGFFRSIYRWAVKSPEHKDRVLTFYRLTHELSEKLKSLFVQFAGVFVRHATSVLDGNHSSKAEKFFSGKRHTSTEKSVQLLNHILDTFTNCFSYDNKDLVDKDFFNVLMQPLVGQIENEQGGDEAYKDRIEQHLTPCIAHFAVSVMDNSLWKSLNYEILMKTRHSSAKVRFAALQVIREVVRKMDTEYLTLLPESVPFLAELMEDESFEVEEQCQAVVAEMEQILGEPLSKYF